MRAPRTFGVSSWRAWVVAVVVLVVACSWTKSESAIERERRELRQATESVDALLYRGIKIHARRGEGDREADPSTRELRKLTNTLMQRAGEGEGKGELAGADASKVDYVAAARELYALREELRGTDEDTFPTLLARLHELAGAPPAEAEIFRWYDSTHEHLVLALLWLGTRATVPRSLSLYELSKVDPEQIADPTLRMAAELLRGGTYLGEDWPLLAEEEADAYLRTLDDERVAILESSRARGLAEHLPTGTDDELVALWHAPGVLLRGLARAQQGDRAGAAADFEAFVGDSQRLGADDDFVTLAAAYAAIESGDRARALVELRKLDSSELLDAEDRLVVRQAIASLEEGDGDRAVQAISSRALIGRIAVRYVHARVSAIDWSRTIADSESGRRLERLGGQLGEASAAIHELLSREEVDELRSLASELGRALEEDLERRGRDWAREAKGEAKARLDEAR